MIIGFWALIAAIYAVRSIVLRDSTPLFADTDDAMRLVEVRDFLAGQEWYDNVQHRLNTPFGAELHWSRLVDLPLAMLLAALRPLLGGALAETVLGYLWPGLLLLALMVLSAKLTQALVGPQGLLPALVLPALSPALMAEFTPGRIDHHSVQILLTLLMALGAIRAVRDPRWAIWTGTFAATALAVATEGVPAVMATVLGLGLLWVLRPDRAGMLRAFGITFGLATAAQVALALPPEKWLVPACDAISGFYGLAALAVGAAFVILSFMPLRSALLRLGAAFVVGGAAAATLVIIFPQCLAGPYAAVDPWLVDNWLSRIVEARPLWESLSALPAYSIAIALPPILALGVVGLRLPRARGAEREEWLMLGLTLGIAVAVMLVQVRGARLAAPLAIPAAAALIADVRARYTASRSVLQALALVGSWLVFAGIALLVAVNAAGIAITGEPPGGVEVASGEGSKDACLMPQAFDDLRALPPERVMTPVDLGSHMLMETHHAVVAAPYHRNQAGVRDAFRFFNEPLTDSRAILEQRGIGLVVICPAMSELAGGPGTDPQSFVALYEAGTLPSWLVDKSLPGAPLKVFAVLPQ